MSGEAMQFVQRWYDTTILPLYKEVLTARSLKSSEDRENEHFVVVKKIRQTNLYILQKAYHKPIIDPENKPAVPCVLKRYNPAAVTITIRPKNSRGIGGSVNRSVVAENELHVLQKLGESPFLHKLLDVLEKEDAFEGDDGDIINHTWLKFEYSVLGSLEDVLAQDFTPSLSQTAAIAAQLLRALNFIHSKGIVHGELTSKNVLFFAPGVVKLSNFTLAVDLDDLEVEDFPSDGPLFYTAPEKLRRYKAETEEDDACLTMEYSEKIDIWSLGILMLEIILKCPPLFRAASKSPEVQDRYILFLTELASPTRSKGSALHHLFYPHFDLIKQQLEDEKPLDSEILLKALPQLKESGTDLLVVLMGFRDDKERFAPPSLEKLPRFDKLWRLSAYLDFVRKCLFLKQEERPSAEELSFHNFVSVAFKELMKVEKHLERIMEVWKSRKGKKRVFANYVLTNCVKPINNLINESQVEKANGV